MRSIAVWEQPNILSGISGQVGGGEGAKPELGLCIIHQGIVTTEWAIRFKNLQMPNHAYMLNSSQPYDTAREGCTRAVLSHGVKWIFHLDTDLLIPINCIPLMIEWAEKFNLPLLSGLYWAKKPKSATGGIPMPAAWIKIAEKPEENRMEFAALNVIPHLAQLPNKSPLVRCDVVGAGCLLIKADIFKKLDESNPNLPYFEWGLGRRDPTGKPLLQMCVLPGQSVLGGSKIEDVVQGEYIPSANGELNRVEYASSRIYDGKIMEIVPSVIRLPIKVTTRHRILALRGMKRRYLFKYDKKIKRSRYDKKCIDFSKAKEEWVPASEIKEGDYISFPVLYEQDIKELTFKTHPKSHLKQKVAVDERLMEFMGWYSAEGCTGIDIKHGVGQINFSFGKHEKEYISRIQELIKEIFGLHPFIIDACNATSVRAAGKELALQMRKWFGKDATVKKIPNWILGLPKEKIYPFLRAFWLGDGYKTYAGNQKHDVLGTNIASKELALGLVALLIKIGIRPTLRHYKQHHTAMGKEIYVIKIGYDSEKMVKLLKLPYTISKRKQKIDKTFFFNNKMWMRVSEAKKSNYFGMVHDLRVEPNNSYILEGTIVHNSEDFFFCTRCSKELDINPHVAVVIQCDHICTAVKRGSDGEFELLVLRG